jgi:hypothetical protein
MSKGCRQGSCHPGGKGKGDRGTRNNVEKRRGFRPAVHDESVGGDEFEVLANVLEQAVLVGRRFDPNARHQAAHLSPGNGRKTEAVELGTGTPTLAMGGRGGGVQASQPRVLVGYPPSPSPNHDPLVAPHREVVELGEYREGPAARQQRRRELPHGHHRLDAHLAGVGGGLRLGVRLDKGRTTEDAPAAPPGQSQARPSGLQGRGTGKGGQKRST